MIPLPSKETALYRSLPKLFEFKQYKKGLKTADQILKKFPEHGETLALKGLMLDHLNRRDEALECIRKGVLLDLNSHVCWHVYGLYYRTGKDYEEAAKCYLTALKHDKDNLQILRDLALMQMQIRDFDGYLETRQHLLNIRPENRISWIGVAIAHHMLGEYDLALRVLEAFSNTLSNEEKEKADIELTELYLYQAHLLCESGKHSEAVEFLNKIEYVVCDARGWREMLVEALFKLGKYDEALRHYRLLFSFQPENRGLLDSVISCHRQLTDDRAESNLLRSLQASHPTSNLIARKLLFVSSVSDPIFVSDMPAYLEKGIKKGIPSLFASLKSIYEANNEKTAFIESVMLKKEKNEDHRYGKEEMLWIVLFLAQHFDFKRDFVTSLKYSERAISMDAQSPDAYMIHAKMLKHAGSFSAAAVAMDQARQLDLSDRYLNTICIKYMLKAQRVQDGESLAMKFAKNDKNELNLVDMQAIWFANACAHTAWQQGKYGLALKKLHLIHKFFGDFFDDQFDFHAYCLRKMTLRSYVKFVTFEEEIYGHKYYKKAAHAAVRLCLNLHDRRPGMGSSSHGNDEMSQLSEAEKKKMLSKLRRAEMRNKALEAATTSSSGTQNAAKKEDDSKGDEFVSPGTDFLNQAIKFLRPMLFLESVDMHTLVLGAEVYRRRMKTTQPQPLALLRVIRLMRDHVEKHPQAHKNILLSSLLFKTYRDPLPEVQSVISEMTKELNLPADVQQQNKMYLSEHQKSLAHRIAAAQIMFEDEPQGAAEVIMSSHLEGVTLDDAIEAHRVLLYEFQRESDAKLWFSKCASLFTRADYFHIAK